MKRYPPERIICYNLNLTIDQKQTGKTVQNITSVFVNNSLGIPLLGFFKFAGKELCRNFYFMYIFITLKGK